MATTKDWSALAPPASAQYFAGGDATDWCVHTIPAWCRVVSVYNRGTEPLYVSVPSQTGTAAVTDPCVKIVADNGRTLVLGDRNKAVITLGTWGGDGAAHAMDITFERHP